MGFVWLNPIQLLKSTGPHGLRFHRPPFFVMPPNLFFIAFKKMMVLLAFVFDYLKNLKEYGHNLSQWAEG